MIQASNTSIWQRQEFIRLNCSENERNLSTPMLVQTWTLLIILFYLFVTVNLNDERRRELNRMKKKWSKTINRFVQNRNFFIYTPLTDFNRFCSPFFSFLFCFQNAIYYNYYIDFWSRKTSNLNRRWNNIAILNKGFRDEMNTQYTHNDLNADSMRAKKNRRGAKHNAYF